MTKLFCLRPQTCRAESSNRHTRLRTIVTPSAHGRPIRRSPWSTAPGIAVSPPTALSPAYG
ncbi:hypothetical protein KCP78_22930 [Salmonella enterica subsp. enterica]|nr:hypothetical protein KCP78_22930 [Salmonella enterica subsp. enterica]